MLSQRAALLRKWTMIHGWCFGAIASAAPSRMLDRHRSGAFLRDRVMRKSRIALSGVLCLIAAAGCREAGVALTLPEPTAPLAPIQPDAPAGTARIPFTCRVAVREGTLSCDVERSAALVLPNGVSPAIIIGGQNLYLTLASQATSYDAASSVLSTAVSIRNLLSQPLGTVDGVTPDASGVRVFFHAGPTVTGGSGTVTVRNADGTGTFTASAQPYFTYGEIISGNATSTPKTWQFDMPSTVTSFSFSVYVLATLRDETLPLVQPSHDFGGGQLTAGFSTTCAIRSSAGVYCWGSNTNGRLGIGGPTNLRPFSAVTGPVLHGVVSSALATHSCGLDAGGAAYCWGSNGAGQIGDGTTTTRLVATAVSMPSGVAFASVAVGASHSCGISFTRDAYCWGDNSTGELGDGTSTNRALPTAVAGGFSFIAISPSNNHTCALDAAGVVYCWGNNSSGQLGDGTTAMHLAPAPVAMPTGVTFTSLAVGNVFSCALSTAGTEYCWGNNGNGQLGDGTTTSRSTPTPVIMPSGVTWISFIAAGNGVQCARSSANVVYCTGSNSSGQLGDGTTTSRSQLASVTMPSGVAFSGMAVSSAHVCATTQTDEVYCWGKNGSGQLGDGSTTLRTIPTAAALPGGVSITRIAVGASHSCGTTAEGVVYCWGSSGAGQLGNGSSGAITQSAIPLMATGTQAITTLAAGPSASHACGLTSTGAAYCWGSNISSQLGDGTTTLRYVPAAVTMPSGVTFVRISVGNSFSCAISDAGSSYCWGANGSGELGNSGTATRTTPGISSMPLGVTFTGIAAGNSFACALAVTGEPWCWGSNSSFQLGDGTSTARTTPTLVTMPSGVTFVSLALGSSFACGLTSAGLADCWGSNSVGQLGDGTMTVRSVPTAVTMPSGVTFATLTTGGSHTCGATSAGDVYCWGNNGNGQLGDGTTAAHSSPALVTMPIGVTFTSLTSGTFHSCAMTTTNVAYCWGANTSGQLGDATLTQRETPVASTLP
jgi:alpha-tubulin suppressor-like RCC1 family protein